MGDRRRAVVVDVAPIAAVVPVCSRSSTAGDGGGGGGGGRPDGVEEQPAWPREPFAETQ